MTIELTSRWDKLTAHLDFSRINNIFIIFGIFVFLQGCSYTRSSELKEQGSSVGGTGDIRYNYDIPGANKHLLSITAAPGVMETEGSIAQRIHIFAYSFAARTCVNYFEFIHDPNFDQVIAGGFMKRTKSYVFTCKANSIN